MCLGILTSTAGVVAGVAAGGEVAVELRLEELDDEELDELLLLGEELLQESLLASESLSCLNVTLFFGLLKSLTLGCVCLRCLFAGGCAGFCSEVTAKPVLFFVNCFPVSKHS